MRVVIDPGHGGRDAGAVYGGAKEADINLQVARLILEDLASRGVDVLMTRDVDMDVSLRQRCNLSNTVSPDLFVSLHCNAAESQSAEGFEVWTSPGETQSDQAADRVINQLLAEFPSRRARLDWSDGDGDRESRFYVLVHTTSPAILVEMGFLSNRRERSWLLQDETHQRMARSISKGVFDFLQRKAA